ncbi:GNAT family N-acetyltransferase [Hamadaea tsunoensis]|uniref:GNAT family N-acetyltransferase n=1 Tax=Hamadaea tsunoensis TaxID=53368 RepID=UPI000426ACE5|nr:GNAT family N-acetyltransferase [Hamadaea tsunoensis]
MQVRPARPADYDPIVTVVDEWWGRPIAGALPRLFFDHFHTTSQVAEFDDGTLAGFLVGILSPAEPEAAYIHFVGVAPAARGTGLGRTLYERFFALARAGGRRRVGAITSPVNAGSIAFHQRMGFTVTGPIVDYDGPGKTMMHFDRDL